MRKIIMFFYFIFILSQFQISNEKCLQNISSPSKDACSKFNGPNLHDELCCYYSAIDTNAQNRRLEEQNKSNFCYSVPYSSRMDDFLTYDVINDTLYKVECENTTNPKNNSTVLARCGEDVDNPSVGKCKKYSSYVDSCCYYNGTEIDNGYTYPKTTKGCYWLGAKFDGEILWGGMKLKCTSTYYTVSFSFLILSILFVIFN